MRKILIFSVAYHPFVGGAEIAVQHITNRISDIEFDMITLNLNGSEKPVERVGNVTVYRIGGKGKFHKILFPIRAFVKARQLHRKAGYDATWSIMASYSGFAALFFKFFYPRIPFLLTLQEGDPLGVILRKTRLVSFLFKKIFKKADGIQAISNYLADFARDMGVQQQIAVIPNGVDIQTFSKTFSPEEKLAVRRDLGLSDADKIVITTSRLVKKNAVDEIIRALVLLPARIKLIILGIGPEEESLRALSKQLKVDNRVIFLGLVSYNRIPRYLSIADVYVRPSRSEGMGNSFIEAMAAGVPVVATTVGGISDFLIDRETGIVCNVDNPESVARGISMVLENEDVRGSIIENAKNMVIRSYDWNTIAERMKTEFFGRVLP